MRKLRNVFIIGVFLFLLFFQASGFVCYAQQETVIENWAILEDDAGLLSPEEKDALSVLMLKITAYGNVAFKSINENNLSTGTYAQNYYWDLFGSESGILFLIDMANREIYLYSDGEIYEVITNAYARTITDNVYRYASAGDYYSCATKTYEQVYDLLEGNRIAQPMKYISNGLLAIILALLMNFGLFCLVTNKKSPGSEKILRNAEVSFRSTKPKAVLTGKTKVYDPVERSGGSGSRSSGRRSSGGGGSRRSGGGGGHRF